MFAYCGNNPVMYVDPNGNSWQEIVDFIKEHKTEILITCGIVLLMILNGIMQEQNRNPLDYKIHMYYSGKGQNVDGKINIIFSPNAKYNGEDNPSFQIVNSCDITDENEQRAILEYVIASGFYSQDVYQRTIDSMLIEWKAHNVAWFLFRKNTFKSTDFDKKDEGKDYLDFIRDYRRRNRG